MADKPASVPAASAPAPLGQWVPAAQAELCLKPKALVLVEMERAVGDERARWFILVGDLDAYFTDGEKARKAAGEAMGRTFPGNGGERKPRRAVVISSTIESEFDATGRIAENWWWVDRACSNHQALEKIPFQWSASANEVCLGGCSYKPCAAPTPL